MHAVTSATTTERLVPVAPRTLRLVAASPASAPDVNDDDASPSWIRHGAHHVVDELKLYFRTMWDFARAPMATADAWSRGKYEAINPFNYFLKSLAVVAPWRAYWWHKFGFTSNNAPGALVGALYFLIILTLAQPALKLARAKRGIGSTWAAGFYVLGGLPIFLSLLLEPLTLWSRYALRGFKVRSVNFPGFGMHFARGAGLGQYVAIAGTVILFCTYLFYLSSAVAGTQRISRTRASLALLGTHVAFVVSALLVVETLFHYGLIKSF